MKMHLNLATRNLEASVAFYSTLLDSAPLKQLCGYALFVTHDPGLELALDFDRTVQVLTGEHFGIVVDSADAVEAQATRLQQAGYVVDVEREETCCYAVQTKVWASDPEGRRWETYFVHEESVERDEPTMTCCREDAAVDSGMACCP